MQKVSNELKHIKKIYLTNDFSKLYNEIITPALVGFVSWVLKSAADQHIKRLYFLARDGYLMYKIALELTKKFNINIECDYLYCSRNSWRIPSYHIIKPDDAYSLIFGGGYKITPEILLKRVGFSDNERKTIYNELFFSFEHENIILSKEDLEKFINEVKSNTTFNELLIEKSKSAYDNTIGYLKQNGLFDNIDYALVDTGWTGSMQCTLKQLLCNEGVNKKVKGFYFGMYNQPQKDLESEYYTYYFSSHDGFKNKLMFNNNLFETMCFAPDEMTVCYSKSGSFYSPVFLNDTKKDLSDIEVLISNYIEKLPHNYTLDYIASNKNKTMIHRILSDFMFNPDIDVVCSLVDLSFSDDVSESYKFSIVKEITEKEILEYSFFKRIMKKILKKPMDIDCELFWGYGSIAVSDIKHKKYYRFNLLLWDLLKYIKQMK